MRRAPYDLRSRGAVRSEILAPNVISYNIPGDLLQTKKERIGVLKLIGDHASQIKGCDILRIFSDVEVTKPNSASNIILALAKYPTKYNPNPGVAIKFSLVSCDEGFDNSQSTEKFIYFNVIKPLVENDNTPHLLLPLAYVKCGTFESILSRAPLELRDTLKKRFYNMLLKQIADDVQRMYNIDSREVRIFDDDSEGRRKFLNIAAMEHHNFIMASIAEEHLKKDRRACLRELEILVMEKAGRSDVLLTHLNQYHRANLHMPWTSAGPILFQTMYTLLCFQRVGLMHNDLHVGNLFIDKYATERTHTYAMLLDDSDVYCTLTTQYFVRIFDFDRGYKKETDVESAHGRVNTFLEGFLCENYGQCNDFNYFLDAHGILIMFYYLYLRRRMDQIGERFFSLLEKKASHLTSAMQKYISDVRDQARKKYNLSEEALDKNGIWYWGGFMQMRCKDGKIQPCERIVGKPEDLQNVMLALSQFFPYSGGKIDYVDPEIIKDRTSFLTPPDRMDESE